MGDMAETLLDLSTGDEVRVTVNGDRYRGCVTEMYRSKAQRDVNGILPGHLRISLELTNETIQKHDLPYPRARIWVEERSIDAFATPTLAYYDPDTGHPNDRFTDIGSVEDVLVAGG